MKEKRRRKPGEGSVRGYPDPLKGPKFYIVYRIPDPARPGKTKQKLERRDRDGQPWLSQKAALAALRGRMVDVDKGQFVEPTKLTLGEYLTGEWLPSLRNAPSTQASYHRNLSHHVIPHVGKTPLVKLTGMQLSALYRELEVGGRLDGKAGGLSARTVRYVHTIVHRALKDAVKHDLLLANPADKATPPTAREARAPEMSTWRADELRAFLDWSREHDDDLYIAWLLSSMTGVRRGELLALRWRDVDLDAGTISVRRALTVVKHADRGPDAPRQTVEEGPTKTGRDRVVDFDEETVAALRVYRKERGLIEQPLIQEGAYVVGHPDGSRRHPERFSREFARRLARCRRDLEDNAPSSLRLHDLRHTHATLLLKAGVPPHVVAQRLGHATPMITMTVYAHVMPGQQREAASKFAALVYGGGQGG